MTQPSKLLQETDRRLIRYIMFYIKSELPISDLPVGQHNVWKDVKTYYESLEDFTDWKDFSVKWDIGTDNSTVLHNWEDPSRAKNWFTWGISRFKICKGKGLPILTNKEEGVNRIIGDPLIYMYHAGYADRMGGKFVLKVNKLLETMEDRNDWPQVLEVQTSLVHSEV